MRNCLPLAVWAWLGWCAACGQPEPQAPGVPLFDGSTLTGWEVTPFGGQGAVEIRNGALILSRGETLTGVTYLGQVPAENYRLTLEAQRREGSDFFCGLTFPVGESHCTLILGGWGGGTVGLSSIDGLDASENETSQIRRFENSVWYLVQVEVTPARVVCRLDQDELVNVERRMRQFSVRPEVRLSRPLGIAAWRTTAAIRSVRLEELSDSR